MQVVFDEEWERERVTVELREAVYTGDCGKTVLWTPYQNNFEIVFCDRLL